MCICLNFIRSVLVVLSWPVLVLEWPVVVLKLVLLDVLMWLQYLGWGRVL